MAATTPHRDLDENDARPPVSAAPRLVQHLAPRLDRVAIDLRGAEDWAAPVATIDMPNGFGEEAWIRSIPDALLVWQTSGADVHAEWGKFAGRSARAGAGTLSLSSPGMPNYYRAEGASRVRQVFLPEALIRRVATDLGAARPGLSLLRDDMIFFEDLDLFTHLEAYAARANSPEPPSRLEMEARAVLIAEHLLRKHHSLAPRVRQTLAAGGLAPLQLKRVQDYCTERLAEEVTLAELAGVANLSPFHFLRAFKHTVGMTPFACVVRKRITRAQEMMRALPAMGLAEIALAVGYESQPAFTTAFKRVTGATPARWRREATA